MQQITIEKISQDTVKFGIKTTIESGRNKYIFYNSRKDGQPTKAFTQFEQFGFRVGDSVSAEIAEENKTFTNAQGKEINFTERTIKYFEEVRPGTPVISQARVAPKQEAPRNNENKSYEDSILDLEKKVKALEDIVFGGKESLPF